MTGDKDSHESSPVKATSTTSPSKPSTTSSELRRQTANGQHQKYAPPTKLELAQQRKDAKIQKQNQHTAVISLAVKNTKKVLKEIGFRRARLRVSILLFLFFFVTKWMLKTFS